MTKIPAGHVLVRADDYAAMYVAWAASQPRQEPPPPAPDPQPAGATKAGLAEAVALLTARANGLRIPLSDEVPAAAVAGTLVILAAAFLGEFLPPDRAAALLEGLGLAAAAVHDQPPGKG